MEFKQHTLSLLDKNWTNADQPGVPGKQQVPKQGCVLHERCRISLQPQDLGNYSEPCIFNKKINWSVVGKEKSVRI